MAADRYVKRRRTKRTGGKLRRGATLHHNDKVARKLSSQGDAPKSQRTARYARAGKVGRRRRGERKKVGGFAGVLDADITKWWTVDRAKYRARRRR